MFRPCLLLSGLLIALLVGCATLKEKKAEWFGKGSTPKKNKDWFETTPPPPDPIDGPPSARIGSSDPRGVLAGRVIDTFNQQRPGAIIQVQALDDSQGEPTEITANAEGYFVIQGLEPGRRYRLAARARKGDAVLGGTTIASPPNVVLVIKVSEDLPAPEPLGSRQGPPATSKGSNTRKAREPSSESREQSWAPDAAPRYLHEPERGRSVEESDQTGASEAPGYAAPSPRDRLPPIRPEYQTLGPGLAAHNPPRAELPGAAASDSASSSRNNRGTAPADCVLVGNRLVDFTLPDLNGQPFRFQEQRGKLTLLDFWGSWCTPCMQSLPYLVDLQRRYGAAGLEIIGIAYEEGATEEKADRIRFVKTRHNLNYKVLMGDGNACPVLNRLEIRSFPTLLLVDSNGEIVWRAEGLTTRSKTQLETEIRRRLLGP
ncbi:MAG: redoxin domain-containing protein [Gemmatales bacterium]|nr:redoxin domain-containing protein [Gemmatales bacterium]MDW8387827.1 redoxin domain-containing protein [Gemmatales bacterium]